MPASDSNFKPTVQDIIIGSLQCDYTVSILMQIL